jgi:hypothetical protein
VPAEVADDLATTSRVSDECHVTQVERIQQAGKVVGIGIHLVAVPGLAGASVSPPVVGYGAMPAFSEEQCPGLPCIGVEGPTVTEDHWCAGGPPVLVEDLGAVVGDDVGHAGLLNWVPDQSGVRAPDRGPR